jgi:hypothetical protein
MKDCIRVTEKTSGKVVWIGNYAGLVNFIQKYVFVAFDEGESLIFTPITYEEAYKESQILKRENPDLISHNDPDQGLN